MSWFSRAISKNIELNQSLEDKSLDVAKHVIKNWNILIKKPFLSYDIKYRSKYSGKEAIINCAFFKSNKSKTTISTYDETKNIAVFFPENLIYTHVINSFKDPNAANVLASYIIHEITHSIDPKANRANYRKKLKKIKRRQNIGDNAPYYLSAHEFDAYLL